MYPCVCVFVVMVKHIYWLIFYLTLNHIVFNSSYSYIMDPSKRCISSGRQRVMNFVGIYAKVTALFKFLCRSRGNVYNIHSFHTIPLLEGSVSTRCSPDTCRSALEVDTDCHNTLRYLAIATEGPRKNNACHVPVQLMSQHLTSEIFRHTRKVSIVS